MKKTVKTICTNCNKECFHNHYPGIVFKDNDNIICEKCGIDFYEAENDTIKKLICLFLKYRNKQKYKYLSSYNIRHKKIHFTFCL